MPFNHIHSCNEKFLFALIKILKFLFTVFKSCLDTDLRMTVNPGKYSTKTWFKNMFVVLDSNVIHFPKQKKRKKKVR